MLFHFDGFRTSVSVVSCPDYTTFRWARKMRSGDETVFVLRFPYFSVFHLPYVFSCTSCRGKRHSRSTLATDVKYALKGLLLHAASFLSWSYTFEDNWGLQHSLKYGSGRMRNVISDNCGDCSEYRDTDGDSFPGEHCERKRWYLTSQSEAVHWWQNVLKKQIVLYWVFKF